MKKRALLIAVVALAGMLTLYGVAVADNLPKNNDVAVSAHIPSAGTMTVPATLELDVTVGAEDDSVLSITAIKANVAFKIMAKKDHDLKIGETASTIPSARLKFTSPQVTTPTEFAVTDTEAASGAKPGETATARDITYHLTTDYADTMGEYDAVHTYTLVAQ